MHTDHSETDVSPADEANPDAKPEDSSYSI